MSKLDTRAELIKLSRLMTVDEAQLEFLQDVPLDTLMRVRTLATERVFSDGRKLFQNLASASKLMPAALTAMIAERSLGPLLCARVAGEMPVQRAVDLAQRMSPPFLAEVTKAIDPKRVADIIRSLPVSHLKSVALELIRGGEYLVLGGFVNFMQEAQMRALLNDISEKTCCISASSWTASTRSAKSSACCRKRVCASWSRKCRITASCGRKRWR